MESRKLVCARARAAACDSLTALLRANRVLETTQTVPVVRTCLYCFTRFTTKGGFDRHVAKGCKKNPGYVPPEKLRCYRRGCTNTKGFDGAESLRQHQRTKCRGM